MKRAWPDGHFDHFDRVWQGILVHQLKSRSLGPVYGDCGSDMWQPVHTSRRGHAIRPDRRARAARCFLVPSGYIAAPCLRTACGSFRRLRWVRPGNKKLEAGHAIAAGRVVHANAQIFPGILIGFKRFDCAVGNKLLGILPDPARSRVIQELHPAWVLFSLRPAPSNLVTTTHTRRACPWRRSSA